MLEAVAKFGSGDIFVDGVQEVQAALRLGGEPEQAELLEAVCSGARVTEEELCAAGALAAVAKVVRRKKEVGNTLDFD